MLQCIVWLVEIETAYGFGVAQCMGNLLTHAKHFCVTRRGDISTIKHPNTHQQSQPYFVKIQHAITAFCLLKLLALTVPLFDPCKTTLYYPKNNLKGTQQKTSPAL
jgi:hypothetical protein